MIDKSLLSSKTDNWSTPQHLFDTLNAEFHFSLDACADEHNRKCPLYYTKEQDGLAQDWCDHTVWCNPPYGRHVGEWVKKAYAASQCGATVVMLLAARTDTAWFHDYILGKAEIRFIRGRLIFGKTTDTRAPFPSMVVVFRPPFVGMNVQQRKE